MWLGDLRMRFDDLIAPFIQQGLAHAKPRKENSVYRLRVFFSIVFFTRSHPSLSIIEMSVSTDPQAEIMGLIQSLITDIESCQAVKEIVNKGMINQPRPHQS